MWTDTVLRFDVKNNNWQWKTAHEIFTWETHSSEQFLDSVPHSFMNNKSQFVFKAMCPWRIITPKGYSVYQLPLFYHQQNEFSVLPGVIDTDYHHEINQQVLYHTDKTEIFIKKGTPFVQYIPFKRNKINLKVNDANQKELNYFNKKSFRYTTSFNSDGIYLKMRKENNE
jgi:hypothetical protein